MIRFNHGDRCIYTGKNNGFNEHLIGKKFVFSTYIHENKAKVYEADRVLIQKRHGIAAIIPRNGEYVLAYYANPKYMTLQPPSLRDIGGRLVTKDITRDEAVALLKQWK